MGMVIFVATYNTDRCTMYICSGTLVSDGATKLYRKLCTFLLLYLRIVNACLTLVQELTKN